MEAVNLKIEDFSCSNPKCKQTLINGDFSIPNSPDWMVFGFANAWTPLSAANVLKLVANLPPQGSTQYFYTPQGQNFVVLDRQFNTPAGYQENVGRTDTAGGAQGRQTVLPFVFAVRIS